MSKETKDKFVFDKDFSEFSGKDGTVHILEQAGQSIQGTYLGYGRSIPHGKKDGVEQTIETVAICVVDRETGEISKKLIPANTALKNQIEGLEDAGMNPDGTIELLITYLGKKESKNGGEYHNFKISARLAPDELKAASQKFVELSL